MRHTRLVLAALCALAIIGIAAARLVIPRARAQPADTYAGKNLTLTPVVTGLTEPTFIAWPPDGSQRAFILQRDGLVRIVDANGNLSPAPFLDLSQQVSTGNEEGLLGLAFDPGFAQNGYLYVDYTAQDWSVQVVRYTASPDHPSYADPATAEFVLSVPKQTKYHQAGMLDFGPDGYLYVAVGDDEQSDRAQDLGVLTGKILRLDVESAQPYAIPPSNPFVGSDARGEVLDYGLRNPWRFSFDRATGDLWIGDVHHVDEGPGGQTNWESVEFQPAGQGGLNFGFPAHLFRCTDVANCQAPGLTPPVTQVQPPDELLHYRWICVSRQCHTGSGGSVRLRRLMYWWRVRGPRKLASAVVQATGARVPAHQDQLVWRGPVRRVVRTRHSGRCYLPHHRRFFAMSVSGATLLAPETRQVVGQPPGAPAR